jgi:hypothetical protein
MARVAEKFLNQQFVQEIPSGLINGSNTSFTISHNPQSAATLVVWRDTVPQYQGVDYTFSGTTITMTTAPAAGQSLYVFYLRA